MNADLVIRPLEESPSSAVLLALARVVADAYPISGIDSAEKISSSANELTSLARQTSSRWIVAESNGTLAGAMRLYDYEMNVRGHTALAGGVGSVAVALAHKRRGVARSLIAWYLDHYRGRGAAFAILHAFRPDFYRALGFGYGTPVHRYRFAPAALYVAGARGSVRELNVADVDAILACTDRVRAVTNGLIAKHRSTIERTLRERKSVYIGAQNGGTLRAYAQTVVELGEAGRTNHNSLVVRDIHAEDGESFAAILAYLRRQSDQFASIVIESQDDALYLAANDPRDGSNVVIAPPAVHRIADTGLGMMYRTLDVPAAAAYLRETLDPFVLRIVVSDGFYEPTAGTWTFRFGPHAPLADADAEPGATLHVESCDLASLVVAALDVRALVRHRRARIEPAEALGRVDRLFRTDPPPVSNTRF